jgi:hypothetical protein
MDERFEATVDGFSSVENDDCLNPVMVPVAGDIVLLTYGLEAGRVAIFVIDKNNACRVFSTGAVLLGFVGFAEATTAGFCREKVYLETPAAANPECCAVHVGTRAGAGVARCFLARPVAQDEAVEIYDEYTRVVAARAHRRLML